MTRKDFQLIATVIRAMPHHAASLRSQQASCAHAFADALPATNPAFDRARFLAACVPNNASPEHAAYVQRIPGAAFA